VSNTFASALWLLDGLFASASMGVDGVNLHTYPGSINGMFDVAQHHGQWSAIVHPLFYGALMFAQAAPAGARLLPVTSPAPGRVRAWATRAGDRAVRVVLINDSLRWPAHVQLRLTGAGGTAALVRLRAPSADATGSVTLGGRSFGTPATSGLLPPPLPRTVTERDGVYRLTVPPASAALMTVA
jgi:hypothetical protein